MPLSRSLLRLTQIFCMGALAIFAYVIVDSRPPQSPVMIQTESDRAGNALPSRLRIPRLKINAPVIPVGENVQGQMDVPADAAEVGWFAPGVFPGNTGSAVFAGHLDTALRTHGVFWNLDSLVPGDEVYIDTISGRTLRFTVFASTSYPYDRAPMQEIFSATGAQLLNLITCNGNWVGATYNRRLVVAARFVEYSENDTSISAKTP